MKYLLAILGGLIILSGLLSMNNDTAVFVTHPPQRARFDRGSVASFPIYETSIGPDMYRSNPSIPVYQNFLNRPFNGTFAGALPTFPIDREGDYIRVGLVYSKHNQSRRLPLYGRPTYPGGNRFQYYVIDDSVNANPIEIYDHNGLELETDNLVAVPGYKDDFLVYTY